MHAHTKIHVSRTHSHNKRPYLLQLTKSCSHNVVLLCSQQVSDSMLDQWKVLLDDAFTNHGSDFSMLESGCRLLAKMMEINPHLHESIGDDKASYQYVVDKQYF